MRRGADKVRGKYEIHLFHLKGKNAFFRSFQMPLTETGDCTKYLWKRLAVYKYIARWCFFQPVWISQFLF